MLNYSSKHFPVLLGVVVSIPVFFQLVGFGIHLAPRNDSLFKIYNGQIIPLSTLAFLYILFQGLRHLARMGWGKISTSDTAVLVLAVLTFSSFLAGTFQQPILIERKFFFLVQTLLPFAWYFLAKWSVAIPGADPEARLASLLKSIAHTTLLFVLLYALQTLIDGGSSYRYSAISDHIGPFYNYKIKKFWAVSLVVAAMYYLSVVSSGNKKGGAIAVVGLMACSVTLALVWSRTGLLAYCVAVAAFCFAGLAYRRIAVSAFLKVVLIATIAVAVLVAIVGFVNPLAFERWATTVQIFDEEDLLDSDYNRLQTMQQGIEVTFRSIFGGMFELVARADGLKPHGSENGYLDLSVRAGPVALVAMLILGLRSCFISWRAGLSSHVRLFRNLWIACFASVVSIFFVFAPLLTVLLEPYSSAVIWVLLGAADGCYSPRRITLPYHGRFRSRSGIKNFKNETQSHA